jgi:hypothetical protein
MGSNGDRPAGDIPLFISAGLTLATFIALWYHLIKVAISRGSDEDVVPWSINAGDLSSGTPILSQETNWGGIRRQAHSNRVPLDRLPQAIRSSPLMTVNFVVNSFFRRVRLVVLKLLTVSSHLILAGC